MKNQEEPSEAESNRSVLLRKNNWYKKSNVGSDELYKNNVVPTYHMYNNDDKPLIVEFLMTNEFLPSVILDLLSFEKWYFHLPPKRNPIVSREDSRQMTTDTATILGFLTLGNYSYKYST